MTWTYEYRNRFLLIREFHDNDKDDNGYNNKNAKVLINDMRMRSELARLGTRVTYQAMTADKK